MNYEEGVVQMSDSGSVKQQALDWLIRMDADKPLTKKEKSEFKQWLSLSEQHCQEFKSLSRFWQSQALVQLLSELEAKQARQASESHAWFGFKPAMATMALLVVGVFFLVQH